MAHCKVCESNSVLRDVRDEVLSYKGKNIPVSLEFFYCSECEREFIPKELIMRNEIAIRDVKKASDGLLTSLEMAKSRLKLGLTQESASLIFGGGRNAFSKYERGEVSQSKAMDSLIRICLRHCDVFNDLLDEVGISSLELVQGSHRSVSIISSGTKTGEVIPFQIAKLPKSRVVREVLLTDQVLYG
jgi:HTH-type transcriptional regulator/antitoxin MqsA